LLSNHAENLQVNFCLVLRNFFLFLSAEIDRNLASASPASRGRGRKHLQTRNQKVLN